MKVANDGLFLVSLGFAQEPNTTSEVRLPLISSYHLQMLRFPFFTISKFPKGVITSLG